MEKRRLIFGIYLDAVRMADVIMRCRTAMISRQRLLLGVVNASKIVNLHRDRLLRNSLIDCDMLLADGQSVVWASRIVGKPLPERVTGIDLFETLLHVAYEDNRSVYLFGAKQAVLDQVVANLKDRYPSLRIAGARNGYFQPEDSEQIAADIRDSGADMLFLGITSPKKEIFLSTYGHMLGVPVLHGVGGSFDVLAGAVQRAPDSWQRLGMEWAFRLLQEPRRLWRRYLVTNTTFIAMTVREYFAPEHAFKRSSAEPLTVPELGELRH